MGFLEIICTLFEIIVDYLKLFGIICTLLVSRFLVELGIISNILRDYLEIV